MVIRSLLLWLWLFAASPAQAAFPATVTTPAGACTVAPCYTYGYQPPSGGFVPAASWSSACAGVVQANRASSGWNFVISQDTDPHCTATYQGGSYYFGVAKTSASPVTPSYTCPSDATLSGSSCICNAPSVQSGSSCVDPNVDRCSAAKDGSDLFTGFANPPTLGSSFCPSDGAASSCASKVTGAFAIVKNGVKVWTYEVGYSGGTCTPPAPTTEGVPTTCKGSPGTVNGVSVCIPVDDKNVVESIKQETTTAPVSAASAPGAAGSTTKSNLGICSGNSCSVTETTSTTTSPGGTPVVTVVKKDMPKDDFCKENPRSISCKEYNLGEVAGQPIASQTVQLGITKAASFGPENAACPAPKTAAIMGVSLVMPYTLLCDFAAMIRPLLIGFAYLSAALTFFGFARK